MEGLIQIMPECIIPCCDLWPPDTLSPHKMAAYRAIADSGGIMIRHVTYHKQSRFTTVEYMSSLPHEWILGQLQEKAGELLQSQRVKQEKMEV